MFSLHPSSTRPLKPTPDAASAHLSSVRPSEARFTWTLALAGLLFSHFAANIICLWPHWYSASLLSLAWQSSKMVVLTAATGVAGVCALSVLLPNPAAASPTFIARNLSASWVLLPCIVLLYEADSPWMLAAVAFAAFAMALALRVLLPLAGTTSVPYRGAALLVSLNGLPPSDSPLPLAFFVAILGHIALLLAAIHALALASIAAFLAVFLLTWRWSAKNSRTARLWLGSHPPVRQAIPAILLTAVCIILFSAGGRGGIFHIGGSAEPRNPQEESSGAGYVGIILYPPPIKKQFIAPALQNDFFQASTHSKPVLIPFDGQYWYFKAPSHRPSGRAHIAHGKPTDVNIHSTDYDPLQMEARQDLSRPVDLDQCAEIDLALTNADTRPGPIDVELELGDTAIKGLPPLFLAPQPIASTQIQQKIPIDRQPIHETLRFRIPARHTLQRFNQITVVFLPSAPRSRFGAKVSIEGFELLPNP